MGELEKLVQQTKALIEAKIDLPDLHPTKVSVWLKLVRIVDMDGAQVEENVGGVHKVIFTAGSAAELVHRLAENMVLAVYGGDVQIVKEMPNLIVKLFDQKAYIPVPGAAPIDQAGQIYLKATVYRWEPSLWDQLFGRKGEE